MASSSPSPPPPLCFFILVTFVSWSNIQYEHHHHSKSATCGGFPDASTNFKTVSFCSNPSSPEVPKSSDLQSSDLQFKQSPNQALSSQVSSLKDKPHHSKSSLITQSRASVKLNVLEALQSQPQGSSRCLLLSPWPFPTPDRSR